MSNSCEDSHVGEENTNDAIPLEGVQEVEGVEEASRGDDGVEQSSNKKKRASSHNGTLHLDRHLKKSCKAKGVPSVLDSLQKTLSVTRKDDETSCIETREFDPIVARQKIATLVVKHELPLNFLEYEAFRDLMSYANHLQKTLSRNTLKSEILKLYQAEKAKAMALLENNDSRVAITTDMWTANNQKKGYMVVTRHFLDKSWPLQSRILRFIYLPAPHTAEFLSEAFFKCMLDWNVERRILVVTLDNCSTNDAMVDRLMGLIPVDSMLMGGNFFHMSEGAANEIQRVRNLSNDLVKFYEGKSGNVSDAVVGESSLADVRFNFNLGTGCKFFDISKFEAFASQNSETIVSKSDLERYLEEPLIKFTSDFDILNWWKVNQGKYPILAQMAKDILVVPVTIVASESVFSTRGRVLTPHRSRLHPTTLEALMCSQHWLWANSKGKILESEIFNGEEFMDEDESGPQVLE
ncbi:BED-type domain-containing protein [Citrus sinensis]|nr:BED-type domain-containing protein [Citrus sinensis]